MFKKKKHPGQVYDHILRDTSSHASPIGVTSEKGEIGCFHHRVNHNITYTDLQGCSHSLSVASLWNQESQCTWSVSGCGDSTTVCCCTTYFVFLSRSSTRWPDTLGHSKHLNTVTAASCHHQVLCGTRCSFTR